MDAAMTAFGEFVSLQGFQEFPDFPSVFQDDLLGMLGLGQVGIVFDPVVFVEIPDVFRVC